MGKDKRIDRFKRNAHRHRNKTEQNTPDDKEQIGAVLKKLLSSANPMSLSDLYKALRLPLSRDKDHRMWEVILSTGLVVPQVGFGKAGTIALSRVGYQVLSMYGTYENYLESVQKSQNTQMVIIPFDGTGEE